MELSLKEVFELIYKRIKFILLLTLIAGSVLFVTNKYIRKPIYTASVQLYVNTNDGTSTANLNELNYAQKVVATYINFLRTQKFYKQVLENTDLNYSEHQLRSMTHIESISDTEIFQISVYSNSASDSFELVEAMQLIAPRLIGNIKNNAQISVVDPVVFPKQPSGPKVLLNTIIGAMVGFFTSLALVFLWELIDVNVKNKEELMKRHQIPIIGLIPNFYGAISKRQLLLQRLPFKKAKKASLQLNQINDNKNHFIINEAYKALRINLLYTIRKDGCKKLLINSPIPEDGKSTTCTNIGVTIAQAGSKVLIIDCDLRKGSVHKAYNLQRTPGLSDNLSGMKTDNDVIQNTSNSNLQVIANGSIVPNPTELLSSIQMEELIKRLEDKYDYIILDSAPVNLVSDALSLAKLVDGVLMVVREGNTSHPNIEMALNKYEMIECKIFGFVLNGISLLYGKNSKSKYYYYQNNDD